MLNIYSKYAPNANVANTNYPHGSGKDESASGTNDGTPLEMDWYNDMLGYSEALLAEAGVEPSGNADTAVNSDRMKAFRIAAIRVETAVAYSGGDVSTVGVIALVTGEDVTNYSHIVDGDSLTRWSVGSVTGTFAGDFNPSNGIDSGLSGALVQVSIGTAAQQNLTNGGAAGDVFHDGDVASSAEITAGVSGKVIVDNELKGSEYSFLVDQELIDLSGTRTIGGTVTNTSGKARWCSVTLSHGIGNSQTIATVTNSSGSVQIESSKTTNAVGVEATVTFLVPNGEQYTVTSDTSSGTLVKWIETENK